MRLRQNYRKQREQETAAVAAEGLVSERYAGVSSIQLRMTYYHRSRNPVLMERTLRFSPSAAARFHVRCEHDECSGGGYDLAPVVDALARSGKATAKGTLFCHGSNKTVGHGSIGYTVTIQYHRRSS